MKTLLIIFLFTITIFSQNNSHLKHPKVFSAIGDKIYNNVNAIENLKNLNLYQMDTFSIDNYVKQVYINKEKGFLIESGNKNISSKEYLNKLRELSKINIKYLKEIDYRLSKSIKENNSKLFSKLLKSNLVNVKTRKKDILSYYKIHKKDIEKNELLIKLLKAEKTRKKKNRYTKKHIQHDRIQRLRNKDRAKRRALEEKLELELLEKKKQIRENQKKELNN